MQTSKILKELIAMFFNNPNLAPMQEYLIYKNVDEISLLLTELVYSKVI